MKKLFSASFLLLTIVLSFYSESFDDLTIQQFELLDGETQVNTIINLFRYDPFYSNRIKFNNFRSVIINNHAETKKYIIERIEKEKPIPNNAVPCDFAILQSIIEEAVAELNSFRHIPFFDSFEEYKKIMLPIYKKKLDEYLLEYKSVDIISESLYLLIYYLTFDERKIIPLEDLPSFMEELTASGYKGLSTNTEGFYPRSLYEKYGWTFED